MSLSIINNVASLTAQNNLNRTSSALATSLEQLSSGLKINRGADGPAALVISEQQRAQISGLQTAIANTHKAVSVVQTAEGGLNEVNSLLLKIRGLAVDSANAGVNDANSLAANQAEISNALSTINSISTTTQFGSKKLLDGTNAATATTSNVLASATASGTLISGAYNVTVSSAATAATVTGALAANVQVGGETLTINGVQIALAAGANQAAQITAINGVSANTGVKAVNAGGITILYSTSFGTGHKITVSTTAAAGTGTGFDAASVGPNVDGTNIAGAINGVAASGVGNTLSAVSGTASGLAVTFAASAIPFISDATASIVNVDASKALVFQIGANAGQTASLAIDRSHGQKEFSDGLQSIAVPARCQLDIRRDLVFGVAARLENEDVTKGRIGDGMVKGVDQLHLVVRTGVVAVVFQDEGRVAIYYTGNQGKRIGESRVNLDAKSRVADVTSYMHFLTAQYPEDKAMLDSIADVLAKLPRSEPPKKADVLKQLSASPAAGGS